MGGEDDFVLCFREGMRGAKERLLVRISTDQAELLDSIPIPHGVLRSDARAMGGKSSFSARNCRNPASEYFPMAAGTFERHLSRR